MIYTSRFSNLELKISDINEFATKYYERLDSFGIDAIKTQIEQFESIGNSVVFAVKIFAKAAVTGVIEKYLPNGGKHAQEKLLTS